MVLQREKWAENARIIKKPIEKVGRMDFFLYASAGAVIGGQAKFSIGSPSALF
jgi:hypothetical protein